MIFTFCSRLLIIRIHFFFHDKQESKYKQTNVQLEKLRVEYQQYKQRASTLLQQQRESQPTDDDSRLSELQNQLDTLIKENK